MATEEEELLLRQLPHSTEAEQAVLGSMLIDPRCVPEVIDKLRPDDFYLQQNRDIYETIYSMFNYSMTIDPVTVLENMKQNGVYDENQSRGYLLQLMDTTPTAANVKEYIDILKDNTLQRRVAETAGDLLAMVRQGSDTGQDILEAAEQRIYAIRQGRSARGLTPISDVIIDVYDRLAELAASDSAIPGLSTGLRDLDRAISGLNKSDLILLAARPGMGKTSMALNILLDAGKKSGKQVAFFSLEMSREQLALRLISSECFVDNKKLVTGKLTDDDWDKIAVAADSLNQSRILIDDGLVAFEVLKIVDGTDIICKALNGGPLSNRKSINVPGIKLNMKFISDKDREDIEFGLTQDIDFIAASFTRCAQDVRDIKAILKAHGKEDVEIICKIENMEGVNNIQEILDEANGVMVARGDLGVEVPFEELPEIQKNIIKTCISRGKRVVTATQMLESMAKNPRPTRAEVSDVANAVYDGTSAIMLSGETSVGKYPVETVATMSRIAENAERTIHYDRRRVTRLEFQNMHVSGDMKTLAISHATCSTSADLGAKCIVAFTESGSTARAVSTYRPGTLIVAATPCEQTFNRLSMSWGVKPVLVAKRPSSGTELYSLSEQAAIQTLDLRVGDIITITAGMPVGHVNYTNTLRVHQLTELSFAPFVQD